MKINVVGPIILAALVGYLAGYVGGVLVSREVDRRIEIAYRNLWTSASAGAPLPTFYRPTINQGEASR